MLTGQSRPNIRFLAVLALSTVGLMLGAASEASAHWLSGQAAKRYAQSLAQNTVDNTLGAEQAWAVRNGRVHRHYVRYALLLQGMAYEPIDDTTYREFKYRCGQNIIVRFRRNSDYLTYDYYDWQCRARTTGRICNADPWYCEDWGLVDPSGRPTNWQWNYDYRWPTIYTSLS